MIPLAVWQRHGLVFPVKLAEQVGTELCLKALGRAYTNEIGIII